MFFPKHPKLVSSSRASENKSLGSRKSFTAISALFVFVLLSQSSCVSYKNQIFFQGLADTTYNASMKQQDPVIQRGDQLMIIVYAADMESAQIFNQQMGGGQGGGGMMMQGGGGGGFMGYLVNEDGEIDLSKTVDEIYNFVRAQSSPYPEAFIKTADGKNDERKQII